MSHKVDDYGTIPLPPSDNNFDGDDDDDDDDDYRNNNNNNNHKKTTDASGKTTIRGKDDMQHPRTRTSTASTTIRRSKFQRRRRSSIEIYKTFIHEFRTTHGGWQIICIGFLIAVGFGSVIGVIPQITTQRYAEELYGYNTNTNNNDTTIGSMMPPCNSFHKSNLHRGNNISGDSDEVVPSVVVVVPEACILGNDHAQNSASITTLTRNILALLLNGIAGSYSDNHGRRS